MVYQNIIENIEIKSVCLISNKSLLHKARSVWKNLLENKEMDFKNGVRNIQAAYDIIVIPLIELWLKWIFQKRAQAMTGCISELSHET